MARVLREALAERAMVINHATALEVVARQFGYANWNILAAKRDPNRVKDVSVSEEPSGNGKLPAGWYAGGRSDLFRYDLRSEGGPGLIPSLVITSITRQHAFTVAGSNEYLTVSQTISAIPYRGQIVSFRSQISCMDATGTGRIWINATVGRRTSLAFDNLGMEHGPDGPITATTDWTRRAVTIAIPEEAVYINFGILFGSGTGSFQAADLSFGTAEAHERPRQIPDTPRNLNLIAII